MCRSDLPQVTVTLDLTPHQGKMVLRNSDFDIELGADVNKDADQKQSETIKVDFKVKQQAKADHNEEKAKCKRKTTFPISDNVDGVVKHSGKECHSKKQDGQHDSQARPSNNFEISCCKENYNSNRKQETSNSLNGTDKRLSRSVLRQTPVPGSNHRNTKTIVTIGNHELTGNNDDTLRKARCKNICEPTKRERGVYSDIKHEDDSSTKKWEEVSKLDSEKRLHRDKVKKNSFHYVGKDCTVQVKDEIDEYDSSTKKWNEVPKGDIEKMLNRDKVETLPRTRKSNAQKLEVRRKDERDGDETSDSSQNIKTRGGSKKKRKKKKKKRKRKNRSGTHYENQERQTIHATNCCSPHLSTSILKKNISEYKERIKFSMILRHVQNDKNIFNCAVDTKGLKTEKSDFSLLTRIMRVLAPEIVVRFGEIKVSSIPNTVNSILARYFSPNPPTKKETMAYELLRLCTLHDFPKSTGQSCIRLAQAAFFYEGKDDEVTCFSCSIQICGWKPHDIPLDRHRETSPNCLFIKCQDAGNVPISSKGSNADGAASSCGTENTASSNSANFVLKTPLKGHETNDDSGFKTGSSIASGSTNSNLSAPQKSKENDTGYSSKNTTSCQPSGSSGTSDSQSFITTPVSSSRTGMTDNQTATQYTITSTNRSRAHYPEYVLVNDRLQSFNRGWPDYVQQTPQMMVESGFFFAGYDDCVRCFQCGIGLRNWEPPDSPHVEHARWSPKCPFLLGIKGQDFINLVLDAVAQLALRNEQSAYTPPTHTESNPGKAVLLQTSQQTQQRSTANKTPVITGTSAKTDATGSVETTVQTSANRAVNRGASQTDVVETVEAKNVLKKGFSENEVRMAVEKIVEKDGWENVTEDRVLKTIMEEKGKRPGLKGGADKNNTLPADIVELKNKNREMREMTICKICLEEEVSIVFLPCGHLVACAQCAPALSRCAVCRKPITGTVCAHLDV